MRYELKPGKSDGHKSFYGKAVVYEDSRGTRTLYSYGVRIMSISPQGEKVRYWNGLIENPYGDLVWGRTTGRHIRSFCGLDKAGFMSLPMRG